MHSQTHCRFKIWPLYVHVLQCSTRERQLGGAKQTLNMLRLVLQEVQGRLQGLKVVSIIREQSMLSFEMLLDRVSQDTEHAESRTGTSCPYCRAALLNYKRPSVVELQAAQHLWQGCQTSQHACLKKATVKLRADAGLYFCLRTSKARTSGSYCRAASLSCKRPGPLAGSQASQCPQKRGFTS